MESFSRTLLAFFIILPQLKFSTLGQWAPARGQNQNIGNSPSLSNLQPPPAFYPSPVDTTGNQGFGFQPPFQNINNPMSPGAIPNSQQFPALSFPGGDQRGNFINNGQAQGRYNYNPFAAAPSNSKSISGDYCFEPVLTCDTTNTLLYCIQGRCTCPTQWTLSPGNLPLNTVWHPELRRCVSVEGSGCHTTTSFPTQPLPYPPSTSTSLSPQSFYPSPLHLQETTPATPTKEIASTIFKGLMGIPAASATSGTGYGYVYCQPGVNCVRFPGFQEVGICAACVNKIHVFIVIAVTCLHVLMRL